MSETAHESIYPEPSEDEIQTAKVRLLERYYGRCIACIEAGASMCQHLYERSQDARLDQSRVGTVIDKWVAEGTIRDANVEAFKGVYAPDASPIEVQLLAAFWNRGLDPVQQYRIAGYVVDFAFPRARLAVEADGGDYHLDSERERARDEAIRKAGWHIVHFTGKQIYHDADACVLQVYKLARSSLT